MRAGEAARARRVIAMGMREEDVGDVAASGMQGRKRDVDRSHRSLHGAPQVEHLVGKLNVPAIDAGKVQDLGQHRARRRLLRGP